MKPILNLVLDFPSVRGLVTKGKGEKIQTIQAFHYRARGWGDLRPVLERIRGKLPAGVSRLRIALSDRRLVHGFLARADRPKGEELATLLQEEVRRVGLFGQDEDLVIGYQDETNPGGGWECRYLGAPESVLDPLQSVGGILGIEAMQVTSIETILAKAVDREGDAPTAILQISQSNARILLVQGGQVLASRLVRLSLSDLGEGPVSSDLLLPLSSEVYRSLEYFRELGHTEPGEVRVTGPLAHCLEDGETWEAVLGRKAGFFAFSSSMKACLKEADLDAYLPVYLLACAPGGSGGLWLMDTKRKSRLDLLCFSAALTGLVALVFGASLSFRAMKGEGKKRKLAKAHALESIRILKVQAEQLRQDRRRPRIVQLREKIIQKIRSERLPLSRVLATVAREKPEDLYLARIQLKGGVLKLDGSIDSRDQLGAIRSFGCLDQLLSSFTKGASGGGGLEEPDPKTRRTGFHYEISLKKGER